MYPPAITQLGGGAGEEGHSDEQTFGDNPHFLSFHLSRRLSLLFPSGACGYGRWFHFTVILWFRWLVLLSSGYGDLLVMLTNVIIICCCDRLLVLARVVYNLVL